MASDGQASLQAPQATQFELIFMICQFGWILQALWDLWAPQGLWRSLVDELAPLFFALPVAFVKEGVGHFFNETDSAGIAH